MKSHAWEQRKLGALLDEYKVSIPTPHDGYTRLGIRSHAKGTFHEYVPKGRELETKEMNKVAKDKLILNITFAWEHAVAITDEKDEGALVSHRFPQFTLHPEIIPNFLKYVILDESFRHHLYLASPGGAGRNRVLKISQMLEYAIKYPSTAEQLRISNLLDSINSLITLHQRKYEKLLNIKKSMLEKMFPKEGEVVPEIRFKGFTGAWEQRKLGELSDIIGGGTPSTGNSTYWDGNINWYSPAEISNQIFLSASQRKISELGYSSCSAKILPKGTVLFTSRAGIGKTAILAEEGCTNQGFQSIVPHTNELDSYFIFSRTSELKKYGEVVGAGSTFVEVSGKQMAAMTLMMPPSINEQKVIGSFFKRLDTLLTLHQRKLEMLKNVKQAFLEKMFV